jgi:hypothetical protein
VDADAFGFLFAPHLGDHGRFVSVPQNWRLLRDKKLCDMNPLARILRTIAT